MKKILLTSLLSVGLLVGFSSLEASAASDEYSVSLENEFVVQNALVATLNPVNLRGVSHRSYRFVVYSNIAGSHEFRFNPGNGPIKSTYGSGQVEFFNVYVTNSIQTWQTGGQIRTNSHGISNWANGRAEIVAR